MAIFKRVLFLLLLLASSNRALANSCDVLLKKSKTSSIFQHAGLEIRLLLQDGKFQEAALVAGAGGDIATRDKIVALIEHTFRTLTPEIVKNPQVSSAESHIAIFPNGLTAIWKPNQQTAYKEVIAYELSRDLGLNLVPVTVSAGKMGGTFQAFVQRDSTQFGSRDVFKMKVLDFLISNPDRAPYNNGNCFSFKGGAIAIDHDLAFASDYSRAFASLRNIRLNDVPEVLHALRDVLTDTELVRRYFGKIPASKLAMLLRSREILLKNSGGK